MKTQRIKATAGTDRTGNRVEVPAGRYLIIQRSPLTQTTTFDVPDLGHVTIPDTDRSKP